MPDLNLMDEGGFEEAQTPAPAPVRKSGGGGGGMKIIILVVVLAVIGGGGWFANKKGWVKIPFMSKKEPVVSQIQEEQYPEEPADQLADTTNISLLETPPVEEPKPVVPETKQPESNTAPKVEDSAPVTSSPKLSEMSGKYTIQVFALHDQKNAEEIVGRLADAGYPAYVEHVPMKEATWYTVRIGKYPSRAEARKAVEAFALELRSSYFIDRVRSN